MKIEIRTTRYIDEEHLQFYFKFLKNFIPAEFIEELKKEYKCKFISENDDEWVQTEYRIEKLKE
jgi:predicted MPP superfamily phosphohydrolase